MHFTKMEGLGNDYIYLNGLENLPEDLPALARRMSDRHFGVGSDGIICICPSDRADYRMRMFNADGSEGEMCGNGIRCLGKYVYNKRLTNKKKLTIETGGGLRTLELLTQDGLVKAVRVNMGRPQVEAAMELAAGGRMWQITPVSMGNPHAVLFVDRPEELDLEQLGPCFEHHAAFPQGVNTEFVRCVAPDRLVMRVWERVRKRAFLSAAAWLFRSSSQSSSASRQASLRKIIRSLLPLPSTRSCSCRTSVKLRPTNSEIRSPQLRNRIKMQ